MSYPGLGAVRSGTIRYATSRSFTLACWEIGCWAVRLPEPMLLRSGRLPTGDYAYEPKWGSGANPRPAMVAVVQVPTD
jgi:hypothetical protein